MPHLRDTTIFSKTALCAYLMVHHKFLICPIRLITYYFCQAELVLKFLVLDCPNIILMS